MSAIDQVDQELQALELQLQLAREKKEQLQRKKEEEARRAADAAKAAELKRRIDNLKNQLAQHDQGTKSSEPPSSQPFAPPEETSQRRSSTEESSGQSSEPCKDPTSELKKKHAWEKPDWAIPDASVPDEAIIKDSVPNKLKEAQHSGYVRQVHEKDLELINGTFVKPTLKVPEPRLVWIVININGTKAGKVVMHLHGNYAPLVDRFLEMKGLELKRCGNNMLVVDDIEPPMYINTAKTMSNKQAASLGVVAMGMVQEGHDIVEQVYAADDDAVFTIKQSHIYPVKKARS
jgi:hypothetical protein